MRVNDINVEGVGLHFSIRLMVNSLDNRMKDPFYN